MPNDYTPPLNITPPTKPKLGRKIERLMQQRRATGGPIPQVTLPKPNVPKVDSSKKRRPRPILSKEEFNKQHRAKDEALQVYVERNYRNKIVLPKAVLDEMTREAQMALFANNMESRIEFARISDEILQPFYQASEMPLYWVTLTPGQYAFRFGQACQFDIRKLQAWTRQVLQKISFVGMVDVGCFPIRGHHSPFIAAFHVHLVAWGVAKETMIELEQSLNLRWSAFIPQRPVCRIVHVSPAEASARIFYMMKSPLKAARWVPKLAEYVDPKTGEITERGQNRFFEQSNRTGQFARLCLILQGRTLDKLAFAAGEGKPLLEVIRRRALAPLRRYNDKLDRMYRRPTPRPKPRRV